MALGAMPEHFSQLHSWTDESIHSDNNTFTSYNPINVDGPSRNRFPLGEGLAFRERVGSAWDPQPLPEKADHDLRSKEVVSGLQ